jgi:hypothetical protein
MELAVIERLRAQKRLSAAIEVIRDVLQEDDSEDLVMQIVLGCLPLLPEPPELRQRSHPLWDYITAALSPIQNIGTGYHEFMWTWWREWTPGDAFPVTSETFSVEDIGVQHPQFFPGRSASWRQGRRAWHRDRAAVRTSWDQVSVGVGWDAREAIGDALDQSADMDGGFYVAPIQEARAASLLPDYDVGTWFAMEGELPEPTGDEDEDEEILDAFMEYVEHLYHVAVWASPAIPMSGAYFGGRAADRMLFEDHPDMRRGTEPAKLYVVNHPDLRWATEDAAVFRGLVSQQFYAAQVARGWTPSFIDIAPVE